MAKSTPDQSAATTAEVDHAVAAVTRFYRVGRASIENDGERLSYSKALSLAARVHLSPDMLRKARVFADAKHGGYSVADLKELTALMRKHHAVIGPTHIIRLISIKDRHRRARLQRETVTRGWSCSELDAVIRFRFGKRGKAVGRKPTPVRTAEEACFRLLRLCEKWQRLCQILRGDASGQTRPPIALGALPPTVRDGVAKIEAEMSRLKTALLRKVPQ